MITGRINQIASSVKYGDVLRRGRPGFFFPLPTDRIPCAFRPGKGERVAAAALSRSDERRERATCSACGKRHCFPRPEIVRFFSDSAWFDAAGWAQRRVFDSRFGAQTGLGCRELFSSRQSGRLLKRLATRAAKKASPPDCDGVRRNLTTSLGLPVRFSDFPETRPRPLESVRERPGYRRLRAPTVPFRHGSSGRLW